ncbi:Rab11 family-interacting protein isoform 1 [Schistosoma japonicum]|uniref:Rab11 family-interacting protein isoform 1 n=1 Tax=Schistosoma japonicum TaxID=6182 RepID=A0A4Z2CPH5_SCHJA|nr:Rab11 family-interacting protein isoform 1 [Schistosoma japonicum]
MGDDPLVLVFKALDTENKGYITVEQFVSTFREFYNNSGGDGERRSSLSTNDITKVVQTLDPENDGIIHFEDFKKAFEGNIVLDEDNNSKHSNALSRNLDGQNSSVRSSFLSDGLENKTDDSGVHMHDPTLFDIDTDSALSADGPHNCSTRLQRGVIRSSWPKHSANPLSSLHHGPDSPASASQSDILLGDMESNFELIRDQMRRMEERVEGLKINRNNESETRLDRLREENARLTAQVTVLEERLKEADARSNRALEAERQHMQSILSRSSREHTQESETLRTRISSLESECSELRVQSARIKADNQACIIDLRRTNEQLTESQEQVRSLQEELKSLSTKHTKEMEVLRKDRDHAVHVLEELNGSMGGKRRSRVGSGSSTITAAAAAAASGSTEVLARYQEVQEIVRRLTAENKTLRQQVEEAQEELLTQSLQQGRSLIRSSEKSWASEIDNCTKEEVVELLSKEKYANEQLRKYIDDLITRIIERHPSLLEIASRGSNS